MKCFSLACLLALILMLALSEGKPVDDKKEAEGSSKGDQEKEATNTKEEGADEFDKEEAADSSGDTASGESSGKSGISRKIIHNRIESLKTNKWLLTLMLYSKSRNHGCPIYET